MAERAPSPPPPPPPLRLHDPASSNDQPIFGSGTYVIQVPKDQIYRVPPPENVFLTHRHRSPQRKKRNPCRSCFVCCLVGIAVVAVLVALSVGVSYAFLKPKNPVFHIQRVAVSSKSSPLEYDITLKINNPDGQSGILYKQNGVASLSFRERKIATGKFPTFHQDQQNSTSIGIVLKSSDATLPKDIRKSIKSANSTANLSLSLNVDVPVRMKPSIFAPGDAKLVANCVLTVDTLSKGTRVLSQQCQTNRK